MNRAAEIMSGFPAEDWDVFERWTEIVGDVIAAGLAATAGTAFLTMLRALRQTGATIEAEQGAVVIPLPHGARGCLAA